MNLSIPTVTKLVGELLTDGYIIDYGKQETHGGRRPNIYGIKPDSGYFVGVDIKRNSIYLLMLDFTGQVVAELQQQALVEEQSDAAIDALCLMIDSFIEMTTVEKSKVFSVGLCVGSRVSVQTGETYSVFKNIDGKLRDVMSQKLGLEVIVDNDSRSMAYGEFMEGVVKKQRNVLLINLNWGLGLGIIIDGELYYGSSDFAGEFGHMPTFDNEVICRCGKKGCLETEVSGLALHRRFIEQVQAGSSSILANAVHMGKDIDVADIVQAALQEDVLAIDRNGQTGNPLGQYLAGLSHLFNPSVMVIYVSVA